MGLYYSNPQSSAQVIELNYLTDVDGPSLTAFNMARDTWNSIITEELSEVVINGELTTKIVIDVNVIPIDGSGNILGQAGPTAVRSGSLLTAQGQMEFDSADLANLNAAGLLDEVILHEMGHVIGIGTLWDLHNLISGSGTNDPRYTGALASAEYNTLTSSTETSVPIENTGGAGSIEAHWRESLFDEEVMTSILDAGLNPLSRITIAALDDLGYAVDYSQADFYALPNPLRFPNLMAEEQLWVCSSCDIDPNELPII